MYLQVILSDDLLDIESMQLHNLVIYMPGFCTNNRRNKEASWQIDIDSELIVQSIVACKRNVVQLSDFSPCVI